MWVVDTTFGIKVLGGLVCVYVWWVVCLAMIKSISLGVVWWCVSLAGNISISLGVSCGGVCRFGSG